MVHLAARLSVSPSVPFLSTHLSVTDMNTKLLLILLLFAIDLAYAQPEEVIVQSDSSLIFATFVAIEGDYAIMNKTDLSESTALVLKKGEDAWPEDAKLFGDPDATSAEPGAFFSGALDGNRAILGDPTYNYPSAVNGGFAYVFRRDGESWSREGNLSPADVDGNDDFGVSVGLSGDVAIVGASGSDDLADQSGSAYIFRFDGADWVEEAKLLPADSVAGQLFGLTVDISDDIAVVGVNVDNDAGFSAGAAYVFEFDGADWTQTAKLFASDPVLAGLFGRSVAVEGTRIVIGASSATVTAAGEGAAYVFEKEDEQWVETAKLTAMDASPGAFFGYSVSLDGNCAAVGAFSDDPVTGGAAYTFAYLDEAWSQVAKVTASNSGGTNQFGFDVSLSEGNLLVAAPFAEVHSSNNFRGAAYIYSDVCAGVTTSIEGHGEIVQPRAGLDQNYPNPFSTQTFIPFHLEQPRHVEITVYNLLGQEVRHLVEGTLGAGEHVVPFVGRGIPAGVYIVQLRSGRQTFRRTMTFSPSLIQ